MVKVHYTYIVNNRETGEFYIGSRSCNCKSEEDIKYMGSMVAWKPNKNDLIKTILNDKFLTREEAIKEEIQLIKENINNPLNKNYNIPGLGFHNTGRVFEKSVRDKMRLARLGDKNPRYGNPHSEETKEKIRIKAKGRIYSEETKKRLSDARIKKPVLQFDKDMNFIKEYESIKIAGENTKTDKGDISKVCNNKQKSAGGWIWKLK
jgi:hypothetical protein